MLNRYLTIKFKVVKYGGYPEEIRADAISMSKCSRWFKRGYYQGLAERAKEGIIDQKNC